MALDVGYMTALGAGALSFLSPCVLPLVPPYLCYMAGVSVEEFRGKSEVGTSTQSRKLLVLTACAFVLGFSTVFVAMGASASTLGRLMLAWQRELGIVAGAVIIIMGLHFLGVINIPLLSREARFRSKGKPASMVAAYVMGLAFAFGWTPCIGPALGPILTMAGASATLSKGASLLAVYSLGLGIPFVLAAMFSREFMQFMTRFRVHMGMVEKVMGVLLVLAGILFITGGFSRFSFWLLETFPVLQKLG